MAKIHRRFLDTDQITFTPTLTNGKTTPSGTNDVYIGETNFDANMVIILAALLCALICALGLNSAMRCALRCRGRLTPEQAAARLAATGLKKRQLRQIPVASYGTGGVIILATECAICLGEFVDGEKLRVLPKCNHEFHVRCIDAWLGSHSSCPNCRHSLLENNTKSLTATSGTTAVENGVVEAAESTGNESGGRAVVVNVVEVGS